MGGFLLGIDVGTSSSKGVLAHADGEIIATSERPRELSLPRPGWAEHDTEHGRGHLYRALLEATAYGVRHILEAMREADGGGKRLVAVGGGTKGGLCTR